MLTIAVVEGVIAAVEGTSRWVLIAFALVVVFAYLRWGRKTESALAGRLAWIGAASQVLVILLAVLALFVGLFVLAAVAVLAAAALVLLFVERGR